MRVLPDPNLEQRAKGRKSLSQKVAAAVEGSAAAGIRSAARAYQETRFGGG